MTPAEIFWKTAADMENDATSTSGEREVIEFISSLTDAARLRIEENLPHGFVRLKVAEAERRQAEQDIRSVEDIVRELARNARDAGAKYVLVGFQKEQGRYRRITVLDDGCGVPEDMHQMVFEPRVTSKSRDFEEDRYGVHGRGMALFSIRSRVDNTRIISSGQGRGTAISLSADTTRVAERADQATLPRLEVNEGVEDVGGGPHNVPRVLLEMSVDSQGVEFYLGSFAEVLATVRKLGGTGDKLWSDAANLDDAKELADVSARVLGLPVSERNAYRVMNYQIAPLLPIYRQASRADGGDTNGPAIAASHQRVHGVRSPLRRLRRGDMEEIGAEARRVVDKVVGRYFLKTYGIPRVRKGRGKITVSFFVDEEEEDQ